MGAMDSVFNGQKNRKAVGHICNGDEHNQTIHQALQAKFLHRILQLQPLLLLVLGVASIVHPIDQRLRSISYCSCLIGTTLLSRGLQNDSVRPESLGGVLAKSFVVLHPR